jgi:hypothetical protein
MRQATDEETGARGSAPNAVELARALSHPTRVHILMAMNAPRRRLSPAQFCRETSMEVNHVAYHFRELAKASYIALVETVPRRGAFEHYYEPARTALAWTREWEQFAPIVRQLMSGSVLSGAVEAAGRAIDHGTFDAREDRHLSWDTMWVDEEGWKRVIEIYDGALAQLLEVQGECRERLAKDGASAFLATYFMSAFEAPASSSKR